MLSNGEYKSVEHRAVVNPETQRLSIAMFCSPDIKAMIGPLADLLKENKSKYKTIRYGDYLRKVTLDSRAYGKSLIHDMKLEH